MSEIILVLICLVLGFFIGGVISFKFTLKDIKKIFIKLDIPFYINHGWYGGCYEKDSEKALTLGDRDDYDKLIEDSLRKLINDNRNTVSNLNKDIERLKDIVEYFVDIIHVDMEKELPIIAEYIEGKRKGEEVKEDIEIRLECYKETWGIEDEDRN